MGRVNRILSMRLVCCRLRRGIWEPMRTSGGIAEWMWKGGNPADPAELRAEIDRPVSNQVLLHHDFGFTIEAQRPVLLRELIKEGESVLFFRPPRASASLA